MSEGTSTLDTIIAEAIDRARERARDEMLKAIEGIGGHHRITELVVAEATRLLREDAEVKAKLREALIRQLDNPPTRFR